MPTEARSSPANPHDAPAALQTPGRRSYGKMLVPRVHNNRSSRRALRTTGARDGGEESAMADRVIFVCTLLLAGIYFYATEKLPSLEIGDPLGPKAFPRLLGIGLVIAAVLLLVEILRARKTAPAVAKAAAPAGPGTYHIVAGVVVWTFLYFVVFEKLGYVIATAIFLLDRKSVV